MIYYFLPAIIALGIVTSYEDIKFGKIRNKWIILALSFAFVAYSAVICSFYFKGTLTSGHFIGLFSNALLAVALGFGLWYLGIWTAGDGKLFIAFSALIPLAAYSPIYNGVVFSINLIINTFVPALIIMLTWILFKVKIRSVMPSISLILKGISAPKELLKSAVYLFAVYWIIGIFIVFAGIANYTFLSVALTIFLVYFIQLKLSGKVIYIALAVSILRLGADKSVYSKMFLFNFFVIMAIWLLISFVVQFISKLGQKTFSKEVKVSELKPGMILSEIIESKGRLTKKELDGLKDNKDIELIKNKGKYYTKAPKSLFVLSGFLEESPEGITEHQIGKIRRIGIKKIRVSQSVPFAPFIFLGALITVLAKGNILILIGALFLGWVK